MCRVENPRRLATQGREMRWAARVCAPLDTELPSEAFFPSFTGGAVTCLPAVCPHIL
jgi:hypothetical protein